MKRKLNPIAKRTITDDILIYCINLNYYISMLLQYVIVVSRVSLL